MKAKGTPTEGIYRRLTVRMYGDEKFMRLTPPQPCGQWLWVYALTGPHTGAIPGVFVMGKAAMAEALGWEAEAFEKAFAEVLGQGLVEFDAKTRIWFIPNAIRHNMPANPNVVRSWRGAWSLLPECAARDRIADALFASLTGLSGAFGEAFREACGKASRKPLPKHPPKQEAGNRKQEQEEEGPPAAPLGERTARKRAASSNPKPGRPEGVCETVWADWVELRRAKKAPITRTVLEGAASEAKKADMTLEEFLRVWCRRGSQGLEADWLKPSERPTQRSTARSALHAENMIGEAQ